MTGPERPLVGVLLGGSGLIGGTVLYHFKKRSASSPIRVLSPNSKELSLRVESDIRSYFQEVKADFIVNCAIAELDSDPQMTAEINCLGAIALARVAIELGIPYVQISSGAVMENGEDVRESDRLGFDVELENYAKGKLIAEHAIEELGRSEGLDYTIVRLGIVYGTHDHKIRGFHRLLFSIVEGAIPLLPTRRSARHSYTNARKLPAFVEHLLTRREEFGGRTYHFVDAEPVRLGDLIRAVKKRLGTTAPLDFYLPYPVARLLSRALPFLAWLTGRLGIEARPPTELMFLERFYHSQVLSPASLIGSSFVDPEPDATIFTELPRITDYYLQRWRNLNLLQPQERHWSAADVHVDEFTEAPERLVRRLVEGARSPFLLECPIEPPAEEAGPSRSEPDGAPAARDDGR